MDGKCYFQSLPTCSSAVKPSDASPYCKNSNGSLNTSYPTGNNGWIVNVAAGEPLTLGLNLMDYDVTSSDDRLCQASKTLDIRCRHPVQPQQGRDFRRVRRRCGCKPAVRLFAHRLAFDMGTRRITSLRVPADARAAVP